LSFPRYNSNNKSPCIEDRSWLGDLLEAMVFKG
jgi:hypothetical protein